LKEKNKIFKIRRKEMRQGILKKCIKEYEK
jgi:hypothetical protein